MLSQLAGKPNPHEVAKPYKAGMFKCTRFDIDTDEESDEHYIEAKKNLVVKQVVQTNLFATKQDVATFLMRSGDPKDTYYGTLLHQTDATIFA